MKFIRLSTGQLVEADVDAGDVVFTPEIAADWDGGADPGNVDDALDQLAERTADLEAGGTGGGDNDAWFMM